MTIIESRTIYSIDHHIEYLQQGIGAKEAKLAELQAMAKAMVKDIHDLEGQIRCLRKAIEQLNPYASPRAAQEEGEEVSA